MYRKSGSVKRLHWTPEISKKYYDKLRITINRETGKRKWSVRTVFTKIAHLKSFAKWIHEIIPFPMGNPMRNINPTPPKKIGFKLDKALTIDETEEILNATDKMINESDLLKNNRRKPFRDRAIIYMLIETGMRRAAVTNLLYEDVDFENLKISVYEKGEQWAEIAMSKPAANALNDYLVNERNKDNRKLKSPYLFLPTNKNSKAKDKPGEKSEYKLTPRSINVIWDFVCKGILKEHKGPHSARHAVGKMINEEKGPGDAAIALTHKDPATALLYSRITLDEIRDIYHQKFKKKKKSKDK